MDRGEAQASPLSSAKPMLSIPQIPLLYVDAQLLVLDKPAGLLSVPGRLPQHRDSVALRVQERFPEALVVHRLDQVTSGLMVMARDADTHRALSRAFAAREIHKRYEAWVEGVVTEDAGEIDLPLICDWSNRPRQVVDHERGKPSLTRWTVQARDVDNARTRLELEPVTGRSHQLRVHLATLGHPIVGDTFYGAAPAHRACLHAVRIEFIHPALGQPVSVLSPASF